MLSGPPLTNNSLASLMRNPFTHSRGLWRITFRKYRFRVLRDTPVSFANMATPHFACAARFGQSLISCKNLLRSPFLSQFICLCP